MKKLFSKIFSATIGLLTICAPAYAGEVVGRLYVNGSKNPAFKLVTADKIGDYKDPKYEIREMCDECYKIKDYRSSLLGREKYILSHFYHDVDTGCAYNHYYRARLKMLETPINLYHFQRSDHRIFKGKLYDMYKKNGRDPYGIESEVDEMLPFCFKAPSEKERVVRDEMHSDSVVFKIEYFKGKTRSENVMLDDKNKRQISYAGYFVRDRHDNIVAKVTGSFFPPDAVLMLYLEGQLEGILQ